MKLFKPYWVNHNGNPIFSIDVHPDGSRFATGGQGTDSGKVVIWNMGPILEKSKELNENVPKMLCQMDHHIACVNCVRWSNNGLFLASGSDDKLIMIWHFASGQGFQNIENWKCGFTLRGHSGDILDLAWSSTDTFLASCSVDNTIIIWNALKFPDIIKRITAHSGLVKGVSWDPLGEYFASQSDDKTLKIWKTSDWSLEKTIDEPFKQCTGTTHVLRLGWSPDGQIILSAHAINNSAPTAQVIDRTNKWNTKLDFVGHRKAVTTVRFYPKILKDTESEKTHCLCAVGSRDRSVSIWLTSYSRPLCVTADVFDNPVMDLSWRKEGEPGLLACSMDGTILYLEFSHADIGFPLTSKETDEIFKTKYGLSLSEHIAKNNQLNLETNEKKNSQNLKFIENPEILLAQTNEVKKVVFSENSQSNLSFKGFSNPFISTNSNSKPAENFEQIERRMPDGRRRITPICVARPGEYNAPKPFGASDVQLSNDNFTSSIGFGTPSVSSSQFADLVKPIETIKQVPVQASPAPGLEPTKKPTGTELKNKVLAPRDISNKPEQNLVQKRLTEPAGTQIVFSGSQSQASKFKPNLTQGDKYLEPLKLNSDQSTKIGKSNDLISIHNQIALKQNQRSIYYTTESDVNSPKLNMIKYILNNKENKQELKWVYYFNESICDVKLNKSLVACVCQDACLYMLKLINGSLISSPIVLDSKAAVLSISSYSNQSYVMVITEKGFLYLWLFLIDPSKSDIKPDASLTNSFDTLTTLVYHQSCQYIVEGKTLIKSFVTESGTPVIHLSENKSYFYSLDLRCWQLVPLNGSILKDSLKLLLGSNSIFATSIEIDKLADKPLDFIQSYEKSTNLSRSINLIYQNSDYTNDLINKKDLTLVQLESQINAALGLKSAKEYKFWLLTLARYLVENTYEEKLANLCNSLLGPIYSANWCDKVLNLKKRDILKEILPIIAQNLELQRLYSSLKDQLSHEEERAYSKKSVLNKIMTCENIPSREAEKKNENSTNLETIEKIPDSDQMDQEQLV